MKETWVFIKDLLLCYGLKFGLFSANWNPSKPLGVRWLRENYVLLCFCNHRLVLRPIVKWRKSASLNIVPLKKSQLWFVLCLLWFVLWLFLSCREFKNVWSFSVLKQRKTNLIIILSRKSVNTVKSMRFFCSLKMRQGNVKLNRTVNPINPH